jgi:23S rRNA pseudouridine955/2504/2580 synthase
MNDRKTQIAENQKVKKRGPKITQKKNDDKTLQKMLIFENSDLIAINKPNGLASQGGDGIDTHVDQIMTNYMSKDNFKNKAYLLHRIDQYSSGAMVLGKNVHYARTFTGLMKEK